MSDPEFPRDFDCVVMLTWSDWYGDPRSNRYHYATRFSRLLPVIFVQPDHDPAEDPDRRSCRLEKVDGHDVTILHVRDIYGPEQSRLIAQALDELGLKAPLLWIYNVFFEHYIRRSNAKLKLYHGTESYLSPTEGVVIAGAGIHEPVRRILQEIDLLVSVSDGVNADYVKYAPYAGPTLVLKNGCDFDYWRDSGASAYVAPEPVAKVAFFQGGINGRLDYDLLIALADAMPDWQFWFCGKTNDAPPIWKTLVKRANVRSFGMISSDEIAALAKQALVGLVPFKQEPIMQISLPLKAYEYVACGLPVVSIPIDELAGKPNLFRIETTAAGFAAAIRDLATTRTDPDAIATRLHEAALQSYDRRFELLLQTLRMPLRRVPARTPSANILMLYDDRSVHVRTIEEHLQAFRNYSHHRFFFMPATGYLAGIDDREGPLDLSGFDALILHYSVRVSLPDHLSLGVVDAVKRFHGPKILFIQDEYDTTETARSWIETLDIDGVFTCVPAESIDAVYPRSRFPHVEFMPTLTGYVPEYPAIDAFATPPAQREFLIGYRGRKLPHQYGDLGYEKYRIGLDVRRLAAERGLPVDIEVEDRHRIYGDDWYRFLGSCRATLGTESGANVFDFDGTLARLASEHADMPYEAFRAKHIAPHEGQIRMNQVSPKIFEAIRLRTALVLFEGEYSGVVQPHIHYIPLQKDYANVDEVFAKLHDSDALRTMTERAYRDVIESGRYSYAAFIGEVDAYLDRHLRLRRPKHLLTTPAFARFGAAKKIEALPAQDRAYLLISDDILGRGIKREDYVEAFRDLEHAMLGKLVESPIGIMTLAPSVMNIVFLMLRRLWLCLPAPTRGRLVKRLRQELRAHRNDPAEAAWLIRTGMRYVPGPLKSVLAHFVR